MSGIFLRAAVLAGLALAGCSPARPPLATYNTVPSFTLTSHTGDEFRSEWELKGRVWVADFIFTTCTGPCPRMSSQMRRVHTELRELPEVKMVSFTVDPENDTPTALAEYAKRYQADPERWQFLTGSKETLHQLNREAFMLGNVDGSLDHSTRFVLVDRESRVRKYYETAEGGFVNELAADVRQLLQESQSQ